MSTRYTLVTMTECHTPDCDGGCKQAVAERDALNDAAPDGYELLASMREWAEGEALDPGSEDHPFAVKILAYLAKAEGRA